MDLSGLGDSPEPTESEKKTQVDILFQSKVKVI